MNMLKTFWLTFGKLVVQWVTVVKFRVNDGGGDGTGSFEVKLDEYDEAGRGFFIK